MEGAEDEGGVDGVKAFPMKSQVMFDEWRPRYLRCCRPSTRAALIGIIGPEKEQEDATRNSGTGSIRAKKQTEHKAKRNTIGIWNLEERERERERKGKREKGEESIWQEFENQDLIHE